MLKSVFKKFLLSVLMALVCMPCMAQEIDNDSLFQVWRDSTLNGDVRLEAFFNRFETSSYIDEVQFQNWVGNASEALEIAEKLEDSLYIGFFSLMTAYYYREQENREDLSCDYFKRGFDLLLDQKEDLHVLNGFWRLPFSCEIIHQAYIDSILNIIEQRLTDDLASLFYVTSGYNKSINGDSKTACSLFMQAYNRGFNKNPFDWAVISLMLMKLNVCDNVSPQELDSLIVEVEQNVNHSGAPLISKRYSLSIILSYYDNSERYPDVLRIAHKIEQYSEDIKSFDATYASTIHSIGRVHREIGNYSVSERYLLQSLSLADSLNDYNLLGGTYIDLAELYLNKNDGNSAKKFINKGLRFMKDKKQCEPCYLIARITNAAIMNLEHNYDDALKELRDIQNRLTNIGGYENVYGDIQKEMSRSYLGKKQYSKAIETAQLTLNDNEPKGIVLKKDLNNILYRAHEKIGNYSASLMYFKEMIALQDSLVVLRNSEEVTRIELEKQFAEERYADSLLVAQKELKLQKQLNTQKNTKNLFIGIGLGLLFLAIAIYTRLRYIRKTETLLKKQNEIIAAEKDKAQASEQAKHQFLANMSHEIRTPMNAIKGMTEILIRRDPKEEQKEFLSGIKQSADSLLVIINDILDISKIEAGKIELEHIPFNLNELLKGIHSIMKFKAEEKGLILNIGSAEVDYQIIGDPTRLRQILINLVGNAIKFTNKGVINVMTKVVEVSETQTSIQFTVSDTGVGIATEHLDKIFNSFEQEYSDTSRKFGGTGLGLSISKRLVDLHNGKIWAESEKGKGSQFHFILPFKPDVKSGSADVITEKIHHKTSAISDLNILLVEDNQFNAIVAQEELEDALANVTIDLAENGSIAVEKLRNGDYDIILMDVQMPVMNGYEATEKIRSFNNNKSEIPIIAMTANVLKEEVERCYASGMNDFIGKPFDTEELIKKINSFFVTT